MQNYMLLDKITGEEFNMDAVSVQRIIGVEIEYIKWSIGQDGKFENRLWRVAGPNPQSDLKPE